MYSGKILDEAGLRLLLRAFDYDRNGSTDEIQVITPMNKSYWGGYAEPPYIKYGPNPGQIPMSYFDQNVKQDLDAEFSQYVERVSR